MRALLTDEHEMLRDTVAAVVAYSHDPPPEPGEPAPTADWTTLVDGGFTAIASKGRDGLSAMDVTIVCEELGRYASPLPYLGCCVFPTAALAAAGAEEALLEQIADGHRIAVALDDDLVGIANGRSGVAFDASCAAEALVATADGAALVPIAGAALHAADVTRVCRDVTGPINPIEVGEPLQLTREHGGWRTLATIGLCADMVGAMRAALDRAVAYAGDRRQFGQPIGSYQAIQHLCAEQHVRLEASRSALYYVAWARDALDDDAAWAAARGAKVFIADAARAVVEAAIQVHGGIGITWECDLHVFLRRVLLDRIVLGSAQRLLRDDARHRLSSISTQLDGSPR